MASVSLTRINVSDDDKYLIWGWLRRIVRHMSVEQMFPSAIVLLFILFFRQIDVWIPFVTRDVLFSRDHTTLNIIKSLRICNSPAIFYGKHIIDIYKNQYSKIIWTLKFLKLSYSNEFKIGLINVDDDGSESLFCMTRDGLDHFTAVLRNNTIKYFYKKDKNIDSKRFMKNDIVLIKVYPDYYKNTVDISFFKYHSKNIIDIEIPGKKSLLLMEYTNLPLKNGKFKLVLHMSKVGKCKIQEFQLYPLTKK